MTPEERADQVCKTLTIREVVLRMPGGETVSFEMAPVIAEAIRQTRTEALEEAAKIAEKLPYIQYPPGTPPLDPIVALSILGQVADAIRERAKA